ncbi:unnamed protein product [Meganyctiphanes norvegica]|uniref:18S rRNA (guanine(1575)-N(7))-methyltransferase Bud23 C-terminal domain-containing protein n=1 Tax=Meganyctiphanes norvegica TaxID=48144 RepID=A0AAV2RU83_MEGNR
MSLKRQPRIYGRPECYCSPEGPAKSFKVAIIETEKTSLAPKVGLTLPVGDIPTMVMTAMMARRTGRQNVSMRDHIWCSIDSSRANNSNESDVAIEREVEGDLILADLGEGTPFRPGMFDGAISISAIQWLCNADKAYHHPSKRLYKFFMTLYACLGRGSRAVFQFYPENDSQCELIIAQAMKAGFTGGLVVDFPNSSKAKKVYLVLMLGGAQQLPRGLNDGNAQQTQALYQRRERLRNMRGKPPKREWIQQKKERRRKQGKDVRADSKFTGRKRSSKF